MTMLKVYLMFCDDTDERLDDLQKLGATLGKSAERQTRLAGKKLLRLAGKIQVNCTTQYRLTRRYCYQHEPPGTFRMVP
jgi:hypothetical protein